MPNPNHLVQKRIEWTGGMTDKGLAEFKMPDGDFVRFGLSDMREILRQMRANEKLGIPSAYAPDHLATAIKAAEVGITKSFTDPKLRSATKPTNDVTAAPITPPVRINLQSLNLPPLQTPPPENKKTSALRP